MLTVDARNHGNSPHSPALTYEAMTSDLKHLLGQLHIEKCVLIGHSMGGKTAMTTALTQVSDHSGCHLTFLTVRLSLSPVNLRLMLHLTSFCFFLLFLCLCLHLQPSLVERLVVVDISPAQSTTRTNFRYYIQAMQEMKISTDIPRSTARRMAEDQLRKLVKVRTASSSSS